MLKLTPKERVLFVRRLTPVLLVLLGVFSLFFANFIRSPGVAHAATASTINFQARLQSASGAIAPDGNYNVEFKLYTGSSCTPSTGSGCTNVWTEDYLNSNGQGLKTVNGYLSANLGSITAFSGINWDQQLWMSMNIGGTSTGTPSWDGAMKPFLSLTAVPYAFSAGQLNSTAAGGRSTLSIQGSDTGHGDQSFIIQDQGAAGTYNLLTQSQSDNRYIQLQSTTPGTAQTGNINISGTVVASSIQVGSVDTTTAGTLGVGNTNATTINIGSNNVSHTINIGTSTTADQYVSIGNYNGGSVATIQGNNLYLLGNNVMMTAGNEFLVQDSSNNQLFIIEKQANLTTIKTDLQVNGWQTTTGGGTFGQGIWINNGGLNISGTTTTYTSPAGASLQTAINITSQKLNAFGSVLALGVTYDSASSARGILVADDRLGSHQATVGVLDASENDIFGLAWNGTTLGSQTAQLSTIASDIGIAPAGSTAATFTATSVTLSKDTTVNANITVSGNVAYKHGTDFATTGTSNDVSFGSGTLFRLTGASAQTITGIAGGTDGRQLTLMNTASQAATLANNSASSVAANRIVTGIGSDLTIAAGASVSLVYDSSASLWHVVGTISGSQSGGNYVSLQATTPGTADTGNLNITGQGTFGTGLTVRTATNSTSALTIQNNSGVAIFSVDTTNKVVNIGGVPGSGTLVNSGSTVNLTLALGNFASGGSIGTAATTVDVYTSISVAQTTAGQTLSLPAPSNATAYGQMLYISNIGSASFIISGTPLSAGSSASFIWSNTSGGAKWQYAGADGNSILNQSSSTQTANFNISGTGVAANLQATSGIATPLLDTGSATTLNIGTTNATSISLNKATLVNVTSTSAFKIQDASANVLLTADTSTGTITFGTATNGVVFTAGGGLVANGTARHGKKISLTPEYAGAVLDNTNDTGGANCATNSNGTLTTGYSTGLTGFGNTTQNYYQWLSSQASAQCYDLVVQVPIPADFSAWSSTTPIAINTYSSNTTNGTIALQAIAGNGTTESNCNYVGTTPASASTWTASGGSCTVAGSYSAGDTMTLRIRVTSSNGASVRVGNISLSYKSSF